MSASRTLKPAIRGEKNLVLEHHPNAKPILREHDLGVVDTGYTIQQISSPIEKDQQKNGKVFAAIENTAATPMKGYVIDSSTGKHYPSTFEVSDGGATVTTKLKVSMIHITTTWKKQ